MAEFTEVMRIRTRMCETEGCDDCPLGRKNNGYNRSCGSFIASEPKECERACLKWAKENPEITNKDKFYQVMKDTFGEHIANSFISFMNSSDCTLVDCDNGVTCDECTSKGFWKRPYVEPKGCE